MAINLEAGYYDTKEHVGHEIECVGYGEEKDPVNVAIECVTCGVVLISFNKDGDDEEEDE